MTQTGASFKEVGTGATSSDKFKIARPNRQLSD